MSVFDHYECENQMSIFEILDPDGWSGKTSPEHSAVTKEQTSKPSSRKSSVSQNPMPLMCLCLKKESGHTPESCTMKWEDGQLHGDYTMLNFGEFRSGENAYVYSLTSAETLHQRYYLNMGEKPMKERVTKLSEILQEDADPKYSLSARACQGILNRANRRGKELPEILRNALEAQIHG